MNFGDAWKEVLGPCDKPTSMQMLDFFYESGGNFIDTANNYQNEESEQWIGEWVEKRGVRDEIVLATKFTTNRKKGKETKHFQGSSYVGNNAKSLRVSLDHSLKCLRTDYIDLLYVHWWDFTTSIEELMQSLNDVVKAGKVIYLGISDTPAWIVSKANQYARDHGMAQFVVYQGRWNAIQRDLEDNILPMCQSEGMAIAPWSALGGGKFKTKEQREAKDGRNFGEPSDAQLRMSETLDRIAKRKGTIMTSIALAYVMHSAPYVFPIVGGRKVEHLKGNIEALKINLTAEEMEEIRKDSQWSPTFPMDFMVRPDVAPGDVTPSDVPLTIAGSHIDSVKPVQPIRYQ